MWSGGGGGAPRLGLAIRNVDTLDNGVPARIELDQRGAVIGRSATVDWSLPDPRSYISSRHCEIDYAGGVYRLIDVSTNGTFVNGATERSFEPVTLKDGDVITIGQYEVVATLTGGTPPPPPPETPPAPSGAWGGWDVAPAAPAASGGGWGTPPSPPAASAGGGATSAAWSPPPVAVPDASGWGTPPAAPPPAPSSDAWGAPATGGGANWDAAAPAPAAAPAASDGWGAAPAAPASVEGWGAAPPPAAPAPVAPQPTDWSAPAPPPVAPASSGWGAAPASFAAPAEAFVPTSSSAASPPTPNPSSWDTPAEQAQAASGWSSAAPDRPAPPSAENVWGRIADGNVVDWARGGFNQRVERPADPFGLDRKPSDALPAAAPPAPAPQPVAAPVAARPDAGPPPGYTPPAPAVMASPAPAAAPAAPPAAAGEAITRFLAEAGLKRTDLKGGDAEVMASAGGLVRRLVAGLVVMLEARARAKSQMGAMSTALEFDGNNPIKFARTPEGALAQLLNPTERGFMPAERAVEDAFHDLQSHQIATLKAMQGALRATLDRFSPTAIKTRAESKGLLARILPGAREAALWQAYEREFGGVAQGSDEAFMEVFSREFKKAYEEQAARRPKR